VVILTVLSILSSPDEYLALQMNDVSLDPNPCLVPQLKQ
jgi:hypothetical protein